MKKNVEGQERGQGMRNGFGKKTIAYLLALVLVAALIPALPAAAAIPTEQQFANQIVALKKEFPANKYWTNDNGKVGSGRYAGTSLVGGSSCGDRDSRCGALVINGEQLGIQCRGYALLLAERIFGSNVHTEPAQWGEWSYARGTYNGDYYAGDVVRIRTNKGTLHWIFIHQVTADKIYYTDCNRIDDCKLDWTYETPAILKSKTVEVERFNGNTLRGTAAPSNLLTVVFDANGGSIPGSEVKTLLYKVVTEDGINLRNAPTTQAEKLTALPVSTSFTVQETAEAEGYTWGKTTFEGTTGWCVISREWTTTTEIPSTPYYTGELELVYQSSSGMICQQMFIDGQTDPNGLADPATYGIQRAGYAFLGWSKEASGGEIYPAKTALNVRDFCPTLETGSQQLTLYARWGAPSEVPPAPMPYTDVSQSDWYYPGVKFTYDQKLMNGVATTQFGPEQTTTRAMLVTVLWRQEQSPAPKGANAFGDVPAGQWYTSAVQWAAENKIVEGMGDGKFAPDAQITRAQMATILFRYAKFKGKDAGNRAELTGFADGASTPDWAKEGMQWAVAEKIIAGIAINDVLHLQNEGNATRAQMATVLMRYIQK